MMTYSNMFEAGVNEAEEEDSSLSSLHTPTTVQRKADALTPGQWLMNSKDTHDDSCHSGADNPPADSEENSAPNEMSSSSSSSIADKRAVVNSNIGGNSINSKSTESIKSVTIGLVANKFDSTAAPVTPKSSLPDSSLKALSVHGSRLSSGQNNNGPIHSSSPSAADANVRSLSHQSSISRNEECQGVSTPRASARGLPEGSPMWARKHLEATGNVNVIEDELIKPHLLKAPSRLRSFMSAERPKEDNEDDDEYSPYTQPLPPPMEQTRIESNHDWHQDRQQLAAMTSGSSTVSYKIPQAARPISGLSISGGFEHIDNPSTGIGATQPVTYTCSYLEPPGGRATLPQPSPAWTAEQQREMHERFARKDLEIEEMSKEIAMLKAAHRELIAAQNATHEINQYQQNIDLRQEAYEAEVRRQEEQRARELEIRAEDREEQLRQALQEYENRLTNFEDLVAQEDTRLGREESELAVEQKKLEELESRKNDLEEKCKAVALDLHQKQTDEAKEKDLLNQQLLEKAKHTQKEREFEASRVTFVPMIGDRTQPATHSANGETPSLVIPAPCLMSRIQNR